MEKNIKKRIVEIITNDLKLCAKNDYKTIFSLSSLVIYKISKNDFFKDNFVNLRLGQYNDVFFCLSPEMLTHGLTNNQNRENIIDSTDNDYSFDFYEFKSSFNPKLKEYDEYDIEDEYDEDEEESNDEIKETIYLQNFEIEILNDFIMEIKSCQSYEEFKKNMEEKTEPLYFHVLKRYMEHTMDYYDYQFLTKNIKNPNCKRIEKVYKSEMHFFHCEKKFFNLKEKEIDKNELENGFLNLKEKAEHYLKEILRYKDFSEAEQFFDSDNVRKILSIIENEYIELNGTYEIEIVKIDNENKNDNFDAVTSLNNLAIYETNNGIDLINKGIVYGKADCYYNKTDDKDILVYVVKTQNDIIALAQISIDLKMNEWNVNSISIANYFRGKKILNVLYEKITKDMIEQKGYMRSTCYADNSYSPNVEEKIEKIKKEISEVYPDALFINNNKSIDENRSLMFAIDEEFGDIKEFKKQLNENHSKTIEILRDALEEKSLESKNKKSKKNRM